jgi:hypothetical protein
MKAARKVTVVRNMREFKQKYLPKHLAEYPVEMFVSKEEHGLLLRRRLTLPSPSSGQYGR